MFFSEMPRSNKSEVYRMPLQALWHILRLSFDHTAAVPKSLHWKPVKCYIHFKELLLLSKVLNAKLESLSNSLFALCSVTSGRSQSVGLLVCLLHLGTTAPQFSVGMHLSGSIICFRVQRDQSSCFQKSKLEGIG